MELAAPLAAPAVRRSADTLDLGYVPVTDAAPLLVAQHKGLFVRHGLTVALSRIASWAAIRDRMVFGGLDGAQMLAPMPLATALDAGGASAPLTVVATLGLNGNTITLSEALLREIAEAAPEQAAQFPLPAGALAAALARRRAQGRPPPAIAVVYPFSSHNYLLRYWLATAGIHADQDVRLTVVPPSLVGDCLAEGVIDGFCAGEPWGSRAVDLGAGRIVLTSADIWRNHPEKVLVFPAAVLARDPAPVAACIAAVIEAGAWLDEPSHHEEAAELLCAHALTGVPPALVLPALRGVLAPAPDTPPVATAPLVFHRHAASFPFRSHGAWWLEQMQRWGHVPEQTPKAAGPLLAQTWRSEPWRSAAVMLGLPQPLADAKQEGGHTGAWTLPATPVGLSMAADPFIDGACLPDPAA